MKQLGCIFIVCATVALGGCGMKGPLFLPDKNASVVTRPGTSNTTTAPGQTAPATAPAPAPGDAAPSAPSTPPTPKQPQDKSKDDSQSTGSTPKS
jgi:predicted small lipoprotein YifL